MDQTITAIYPLHRLGNPHHRCETHFERIDPSYVLHHHARILRRQWLPKRDQRIHLITRGRGGKPVLCPLYIIRQGFVIIPPQLVPHQPGRWRMVLPGGGGDQHHQRHHAHSRDDKPPPVNHIQVTKKPHRQNCKTVSLPVLTARRAALPGHAAGLAGMVIRSLATGRPPGGKTPASPRAAIAG